MKLRNSLPLSAALMGVLGATVFATFSAQLPQGTIQVPAGKGTWIDGPPNGPKGTKMMILEGNPGKAGMFTIRVKVPAGSRLEPHYHPQDERVTILSGVAKVGFGDRFDEGKMATFGPGSFYLNPAKSHHFILFAEDTEMQLTGQGPWELHYLADGQER